MIPLLTALSIVPGQSVCTQSPESHKLRIDVAADGRKALTPGLGEKVA